MAKNYFKKTFGSIAASDFKQETFLFEDSDPNETRSALNMARESYNGRGILSVWRAAPTIPSYVPVIGWTVDP